MSPGPAQDAGHDTKLTFKSNFAPQGSKQYKSCEVLPDKARMSGPNKILVGQITNPQETVKEKEVEIHIKIGEYLVEHAGAGVKNRQQYLQH